MSAAFLSTLGEFDKSSRSDKLGCLTEADASRGFATRYTRQTDAWLVELDVLSRFASECVVRNGEARHWTILLEFDIPRRGKRPDAILIADDLIFVVEFKVGASEFAPADRWQVLSYALDLRDFHAESAGRRVIPILIRTGTPLCVSEVRNKPSVLQGSGVVLPAQMGADAIGVSTASLICGIYDRLHSPESTAIDASKWNAAEYRPTPTIIEAAQRIFAGHGVANISHAFAYNLTATCDSLLSAVREAKRTNRRVICFVTGIPGAGKTLAGLNVAHDPFFRTDGN